MKNAFVFLIFERLLHFFVVSLDEQVNVDCSRVRWRRLVLLSKSKKSSASCKGNFETTLLI